MLSTTEIKKIVDAHREVFATKMELADFREEMRGSYSNMLTAVDTYGSKADKYFQEMVVLSRQVDRLEKWVHEIANKVGVDLWS